LLTRLVISSFLLAAAVPSPAPGADTRPLRLDLESAISRALRDNLSLSLQSLGTEASRIAVASAEAEFALHVIPEVSADLQDGGDPLSSYGLDVSRRLRYGTGVAVRAGRTEASGDLQRTERWSIEVSQPLLRRRGRLINEEPLVRAERRLAAAERRVTLDQADLVLDVVTTYEGVLRLQRQLAADAKALERADLLGRLTEAKERLGRATRIDTLRVSLQRGELEAARQNTLESLELTRRDLAVLLGLPPDASFELTPTPELELRHPSLDEALRIAFGQRLDYAQALADAEDTSRGIRIARRGLLPDLAATVRYDEVSSGLGGDGGVVLVGLRTSSEVLGPERRLEVSRAVLDEAVERQRIRILEQLIARDVQKAWLSLRRSRTELTILERNLEHAASRLTLADKLFRAGRGDNFAVVDAEEAFLRAESALFAGRAAVSIDGYRLLRALGTLVEAPEHLLPREAIR
jgi:outer membrane protein TolC